jgi:hypothetical protein
MTNIFRDPKFWTVIVDAAVILIGYFIGKYAPQYADDVKLVIVTVQPIFAIIIAGVFLNAKINALSVEIKAFRLNNQTESKVK